MDVLIPIVAAIAAAAIAVLVTRSNAPASGGLRAAAAAELAAAQQAFATGRPETSRTFRLWRLGAQRQPPSFSNLAKTSSAYRQPIANLNVSTSASFRLTT